MASIAKENVASRERAEAADSFLVSVIDASTQEPIEGVMCALVSDERRRLAMTDALGRFKVLSLEREGVVELSAPGYRGEVLTLREHMDGRDIELFRARHVMGSFVDRDGNSAPVGSRVVAFDSTLGQPDWAKIRPGYFHSGNEVDVAVVGADGKFELSRLAVGVEYGILGVGPGILSEYQLIHDDSEIDEITLLGGELRVARVEFFDSETGGSLRSHPGMRGRNVGVFESFAPNPEAKAVQVSEDVLSLVGFAFERALGNVELETWNLSALVCFGAAEYCFAEVEATLPAYTTAQFRATYASSSGYLGPTRVGLFPSALGWSSLTVQLRSLQWPEATEGRGLSVAGVRLIPQLESDTGSNWLDLPIDLSLVEQRFEGIPIGQYSAQLRVRNGLARVNPEGDSMISLKMDGASISFDLGSLCSTEFAVTNQSMASYNGKLRGVLLRHREGRTQETSFYFPGPPYTFIGLPEGEYSLMVDPPVMFPRPAAPASAGAKFRVGPETAGIVHDLEVVF